MALDSLTGCSIAVSLNWTAAKNITGTDYAPINNASNVRKSCSLGTAAANAAAGGADELASFIQSIAASGSATIDLTSFTDILNIAASSFVRVKAILIRLMSVADDAAVGTACSGITIGNAASNQFISQSGTGWLSTATSVIDVPGGGFIAFGVANAAGVAVDGTHKSLKVLNLDGAVAAKVQISLIGGST